MKEDDKTDNVKAFGPYIGGVMDIQAECGVTGFGQKEFLPTPDPDITIHLWEVSPEVTIVLEHKQGAPNWGFVWMFVVRNSFGNVFARRAEIQQYQANRAQRVLELAGVAA